MAKAAEIKLKDHFNKNIVPALQKELNLKNVNSVPKMIKVKLNVGLGPWLAGKKDYTEVIDNLAAITGQKPVVTKARKAISNFKIREDMPVGVTVTLRGRKMYDFVNKLVNVTLPRVRDFRGLPLKGFDQQGNYTLGIKEAPVFLEVNPEHIERIHGLEVTIVTSAKDKDSGYKLLKSLGFPFHKPTEGEETSQQ